MLHVAPDVSATIEDVTITGGTFIYHGAGVMNEGNLTLRNSTVSGNRAWHTGGGITAAAGSVTTLVDVTVSGNEAYVLPDEIGVGYSIRDGSGSTGAVTDGGWGGGIYHVENATGDNLTPDDPVASPEVVFAGGNTASGNAASSDYGLEAYSTELRMGLHAEEGPGRPMEPLQGRKNY